MNDKIKSILANNEEKQVEEVTEDIEATVEIDTKDIDENRVVTTEEEIQGINIVKSILSEIVPIEDIDYKDVERYCGILYKNNTRKWICRLYFNSAKKSIIIAGEDKKATRYYIENINDIYKYKNELIESLNRYVQEVEI